MVQPAHDPQLLKGVLPILVLAALAAQESYGYELVTRLQEAGLNGIAAGTVYPVLTRLERAGALTARLVESSSGPARKYYRLTPDGANRLALGYDEWRRIGLVVTALAAPPMPSPSPVARPRAPLAAQKEDSP